MAEIDLMKKCASASQRMRRNIVDMTYNTGKTGAHLEGVCPLLSCWPVCMLVYCAIVQRILAGREGTG